MGSAVRYQVENRTLLQHCWQDFAFLTLSFCAIHPLLLLKILTHTHDGQVFEVGEVLGSKGNTKAKKLRHGGTLFARITAAPMQDMGTLRLKLRGVKLKNVDGFFGKSDPFLEISSNVSAAGGLTWHPVYRSKPIMNELDPNWPPFSVDITRICDGDLNKPILIEVWDWEKSGKHTAMGKIETTVNGLLAAQISGGDGPAKSLDTTKAFTLIKGRKEYGKIVVATAALEGYGQSTISSNSTTSHNAASFSHPQSAQPASFLSSSLPAFSNALNYPPPSFHISAGPAAFSKQNVSAPHSAPHYEPAYAPPSVRPTFVDYVAGGCEFDLSIAIDFTGSNGDPRKPGTLHYRYPDGQLNDYEKAITAVGGVVARYDTDQKFPVFGFGAKYGGVLQHCFQVGSKPELDGIAGVLEGYRGVFRTGLTMSGPTVFSEVIDFAAATARSKQEASKRIGQQSYKILLILTDGAVTDLEQTKRAIRAASDAPLSIVIVGIGNADFSYMRYLDNFQNAEGGRGGRDIVQFVQFSHHAHDRSSLTRATLEEIPDQLVDYFYNRGIKPLPPISGSQFSLNPDEPTDEDIDLSVDVSPEGEISLADDYDGTVYDDTKYASLSDYSSLTPMPVPSAPYQPSPNAYGHQPDAPAPYRQPQVVPTVQPTFFHVQVPANTRPGMQLQIQNPATQEFMIVTVPPGVPPGGKFAVQY